MIDAKSLGIGNEKVPAANIDGESTYPGSRCSLQDDRLSSSIIDCQCRRSWPNQRNILGDDQRRPSYARRISGNIDGVSIDRCIQAILHVGLIGRGRKPLRCRATASRIRSADIQQKRHKYSDDLNHLKSSSKQQTISVFAMAAV
jgi:hypothetical protein